jgi:hypothetical protein
MTLPQHTTTHNHPETTTATHYPNAPFHNMTVLRTTVLIVVAIVGLASATPLSSEAKSEGCCAQVNGVCCPAGNACEQAGMTCETSCCTDATPALMNNTQAKSDSEGCCAQVNGVCCPAGNACEQAGMTCETSCCTDATASATGSPLVGEIAVFDIKNTTQVTMTENGLKKWSEFMIEMGKRDNSTATAQHSDDACTCSAWSAGECAVDVASCIAAPDPVSCAEGLA